MHQGHSFTVIQANNSTVGLYDHDDDDDDYDDDDDDAKVRSSLVLFAV